MITSANNKNIKEILSEESNIKFFYKIPAYQREYSWKEENWENLFNDIKDNNKGYFLGSIICIQKENDNDKQIFDLVDGQQRITTISILLISIYNKISKMIEENSNILGSKNSKQNRRNYDLLEELLVKDNNPTLQLSISNNNKNDYKYLLSINDLISERIDVKNFGNRRISKAYKYFLEKLDEELEKNTEKVIFDFFEKLSSAFLVKIVVKDETSAFTLFESINSKGMPLTPLDLIKNSIIEHLSKNTDKNAETINEEWNIIIKNIEDYTNQVRFLRHYYNAMRVNNLLDNIPKATKTNIIKIYKELIKKEEDFILQDLIEKSKIYKYFIAPDEIDENNEKVYKYKNKLIDLLNLGVAPAYTLLLFVFSKYPNEDFSNLLELIENWFIRRQLTNTPPTSKLDDIFMNAVKEIQNEYDFGIIKDLMTKSDIYVTDEEFKKFLLKKPIYDINSDTTRYLLLKLERSKRKDENELENPWKKNKNKKVWSVEHILPQTPNKKSDWKQYFSDDEIENYVHRIGNLSLIWGKNNSSLSNDSFYKKLENENGYQNGAVQINSYIKDNNIQEWTKNDIEKRGEKLVEELMPLLTI